MSTSQNKDHKTPNSSDGKSGLCFTIMPFGGWFDEYYIRVYKPAIENSGLVPHRADDLYRPGNIIEDIWNYTKKATIFLADLTGKNPNVFYELGLAHALAKPVILITESIDDVPFDLRGLRIIEYDKSLPDWGEELRKNIKASIKEVLSSPSDSVPSYFLEVAVKSSEKSVTQHEKDIIELKQNIEQLNKEIASQRPLLHKRTTSVSPDIALKLIKQYLKEGLNTNQIIDNLGKYGVPPTWVINELEKEKLKQQKEDDIPF